MVTGLFTAEFLDLFYIKLQADWKLFQVDPISFELQEPDWLSGEYDRIEELKLETCQGGYFNAMALPMQLTLDINVKRCESSIVDWITGDGPAGPGFHVYCFYEPYNEIALLRPLQFTGFQYKYAYF